MKLRTPFIQTRRDAWVEINLGHIENNIKALKQLLNPETNLLAVVKADAYGHDATMVAPTLAASGVDMFGVASVDEGLQLRNAGVSKPILVLGAVPEWAFDIAVKNDIQLSIFTKEHIKACKKTYKKLNIKPKIHIKVDTGMNRIGVAFQEFQGFFDQVLNSKAIDLKGVFTHLACAENEQISSLQKSHWESIIHQLKDKEILLHCVNTSGLIGYPELHYNMVRAGIGIYGLMPDLHKNCNNIPELKQVLGLKGRIIHTHTIPPNSGVSYGYSFISKKEVTVATIPIGYADGISRNLSNRIYGLIKGQKVQQIGNITMDQMMFDITDIENIKTGDIITLLGEDNGSFITIEEWANLLNTINYEITCRLKVRLPRVYTR